MSFCIEIIDINYMRTSMGNCNSKKYVIKTYHFDEMNYRNFRIKQYTLFILVWFIAILIIGPNGFAAAYTVIIICSCRNHYQKSKEKYIGNTVKFINVDGTIEAHISIIKWRSEKFFAINKVYKVKHNRFFIKVTGEINFTKSYFYRGASSTFKRNSILIPPYFEDMYQIYYYLKNMKENTYKEPENMKEQG